jgi:TIR domain
LTAQVDSNGAATEDSYDLFVSYAHADDEIPANASMGWVSTLVSELRKVLRRKLGRDGAKVWMDDQLASNERVTEALTQAATRSRTLLIVMSPGYRKSEWCRRELSNFITGARAAGRADCIFPIEIEPVERAHWPQELLDLTPIRFWEQGQRAPRLTGFPSPKADEDSTYWLSVNELAHAIAKHLELAAPTAFPHPREIPAVVPEASAHVLLQSPASLESRAETPLQIYVHAAPEDLTNADRIAEHLASAGVTVFSTPLPDEGQSYLDCLRRQQDLLQDCDGLLLVQGMSPSSNLTVAFQLALKVFGVRRTGVWGAALLLPPPGKRNLPIRSPNLVQLDCSGGFEFAILAPFLTGLRPRPQAEAGSHV